MLMAEMTPFVYGGFWDVPRYISLRCRDRWIILTSEFDEAIDEYPDKYLVFLVSEPPDNSFPVFSPQFFDTHSMTCLGKIPILRVVFDPTMRKEMDASI